MAFILGVSDEKTGNFGMGDTFLPVGNTTDSVSLLHSPIERGGDS